jgi:hypothetical protein
MKTEEKTLDVGGSQNHANTPAVLTITSVPASQVSQLQHLNVVLGLMTQGR